MAVQDTYRTYDGDGTTTDFAIPFDYADENEVVVTKNGSATAYTFANPSVIKLSTPLGVGSTLTIRRQTSISDPAVVWTNGSITTAQSLNAMVRQLLFGLQETYDLSLNANEQVVSVLGAVEDIPQLAIDAQTAITGATAATTAANTAAAAALSAAAGSSQFTQTGVGAVTIATDAKLKALPLTLGDFSSISAAIAANPSKAVFTDSMLRMRPAAGLNLVLDITHTLTGTQSAGFNAHLINITDQAILTDAGAFMNGFTVQNYGFGGSSVKGGRQTIYGILDQTSPTNSLNLNRNYVAGAFNVTTHSGDGGTNLTGGAKGAYFGINPVAIATSGATNLYELTGGEVNVAARTGSSVKHKFGFTIVGMADDAVQGSESDVILGLSNQAGAVGWNLGVAVTPANGAFPLKSTGTVLYASGGTIANGIDLSGCTITGAILKGANAFVSESGGVSIFGGNGQVALSANNITLMNLTGITGGNVQMNLVGQGAGAAPFWSMAGTPTDIDFIARAKGAGTLDVNFPTAGTAGASAGYITIKVNGVARKLQIYAV